MLKLGLKTEELIYPIYKKERRMEKKDETKKKKKKKKKKFAINNDGRLLFTGFYGHKGLYGRGGGR